MQIIHVLMGIGRSGEGKTDAISSERHICPGAFLLHVLNERGLLAH